MVGVHNLQEFGAVQNQQATGFDFDDLFAFHLLQLLVHALTRSAQQLRQFFLRQLQLMRIALASDKLGTP